MVARILSVLALATSVLAHPNHKRHAHLHHGTGTGGLAMPTGGAYPMTNGTDMNNGTGFGGAPMESPSSTVLPTAPVALTVTVSPIPLAVDASSAPTAIAVPSTTAVAPAAGSPPSSPAGSPAPAPGSGDAACSVLTSTITSTSVQFVTVTASSGLNVAPTGGSGPSGGPGAFYGASSSSSSSIAVAPTGGFGGEGAAASYGSSSSSSSVVAATSSMTAPSGGAGEFFPAASSSTTSSSTTTSATSSLSIGTPTAGEFFPSPGKSTSFSVFGGSSSMTLSAPVVATTFATFASSAPSSVVVSMSSAVPSSSPSSVPSSGGSSGGKKGLSYNNAALTDAFAGQGISWAYNWGSSPDGTIVAGAEYVPMFWGEQSVSGWASAAAAAIAGGATAALSVNEPDLSSQSNLSPAAAAALHIANMNPLAGQVEIGSPAITNGAGTNPLMGIDWLNAFFKACAGQCKVDFVAFHWYDSATNFAYFQSHAQDVINAAAANGVGKVWVTEFGASGSDSQVASFLDEAIPWLESQSAVERYAYFMCSNGILVDGTSVSPVVGAAYAAA